MGSRVGDRLSAEEGFTLIELMVALLIGTVVILAAGNLLDSSGRAATATADRVDSTQRGRTAMEQITQRLRSQVCPTQETTPVLYGDNNRVTFYADLPGPDPTFIPEVRSIYYSAGTNAQTDPSSLREDIFRYTTSPSVLLPTAAQIADYSRQLPTAVPPAADRRRLASNIAPIRDTANSVQPVFSYYGFTDDNPALALRQLATPLSTDDKDRVVRITVAFDSRPTRGDVQDSPTPARKVRGQLDTRFENEVFVRSADPLQKDRDPAPCI